MAPVAQAPRRYFIEFNAALVVYIGTVVGRKFALQNISDPVWRDLIMASPIVPIILAALAIFRFYQRMDEYHKRQLLEALSFSAAVTAVVSASWGFLEDAGMPHLQLFSAMMVMMLSWGVAALYNGLKEKIFEGLGWAALRSAAVTLIYLVTGTTTFAAVGLIAGFATPWGQLALMATTLFIARMGVFIFSKSSSC